MFSRDKASAPLQLSELRIMHSSILFIFNSFSIYTKNIVLELFILFFYSDKFLLFLSWLLIFVINGIIYARTHALSIYAISLGFTRHGPSTSFSLTVDFFYFFFYSRWVHISKLRKWLKLTSSFCKCISQILLQLKLNPISYQSYLSF